MKKIEFFLDTVGALLLAAAIISGYLLSGVVVNIYLGVKLLKFLTLTKGSKTK